MIDDKNTLIISAIIKQFIYYEKDFKDNTHDKIIKEILPSIKEKSFI